MISSVFSKEAVDRSISRSRLFVTNVSNVSNFRAFAHLNCYCIYCCGAFKQRRKVGGPDAIGASRLARKFIFELFGTAHSLLVNIQGTSPTFVCQDELGRFERGTGSRKIVSSSRPRRGVLDSSGRSRTKRYGKQYCPKPCFLVALVTPHIHTHTHTHAIRDDSSGYVCKLDTYVGWRVYCERKAVTRTPNRRSTSDDKSLR